jgi:hypothetical protein
MGLMAYTQKILVDVYDLERQKMAEPKANNSIIDIIVKSVRIRAVIEKGMANARLTRYIPTLFWQQALQSCH